MKPQRIQRKRTKGWKMPINTVMVGRPSKFGNPFRDIQDIVYLYSERRYRQRLDPWIYYGMKTDDVNCITLFEIGCKDPAKIRTLVGDYDGLLLMRYFERLQKSLSELRGKNLACWCPLTNKKGEPVMCHADVLLKLANE